MTDPRAAQFEEAVRLKYESRDVGARGIEWFVLLFVISVGLVLWGVWWFLGDVAKKEDAGRARLSPLALPQALPPEPRLQPSPGHDTAEWQDLAKLHEQEYTTLDHYGWVDQTNGIAHIPITRALDIAVNEHLLARESATQPRSEGGSP